MSGFSVKQGILQTPDYLSFRDAAQADEAELIEKALTTGNGIVSGGATGAQALRQQFLHDTLELSLYAQADAEGIKHFPVEKAYSTTVEWTSFDGYGATGDGFTQELGDDGLGNLVGSDDAFTRRTRTIKYLKAQREIGVVTQQVRNIKDPVAAAEQGATLELVKNMNLALYWGDEHTNQMSFTGIKGQVFEKALANPSAYSTLLYDAGGYRIDGQMLTDIQAICAKNFGNPSLLLQSVDGYNQTEASLFQQQRGEFGSEGYMGGDRSVFRSGWGNIKRVGDKMLRANRPLNIAGIGYDGKPRDSASGADATYPAAVGQIVNNPFTSVTAIAGGSGYYFDNRTLNDRTPSTDPVAASPNNLSGAGAVTAYYAISLVIGGAESKARVYGVNTSAAGSIGTGVAGDQPTGVAVAQGQIVKVVVNDALVAGGLSASYKQVTRIRLYSYVGTSAPTALSQFSLVDEFAFPSGSSTATIWDNGMYIPGGDSAFLLTQARDGHKSVNLMQLLPMMKRDLPNTAMTDRFAMLAFVTPILWVPEHHIIVRNVGTKTR